jgi:regulator of protease activity HflC (stomatin/prohibitin superfamily)
LLVATTVHIVPAGNVGVPVTLGKAGDPVGQGLHVTWPFTSMKIMSARTTAYTMSAAPGEGNRGNVDDSVQVLGSDGASGSIDSTVLYRLDTARATEVYEELGVSYVLTLVRPSARTCIRSVFTDATMVEAATTAWHRLEQEVTDCMAVKLEPRGVLLEDFQLREVHLDPTLQAAVTAKTAAQQDSERQQFELSIAQQRAEITRVDAIATADAQQILACGGRVEGIQLEDGTTAQVVVPNPVDQCSQAQLTPAYLQWTYIQALRGLVDSPNNSTIILPFDQSLTPLINVSGAPGTGTAATPPDTGAQVSEPASDTTTTTSPSGG